MDRTQKPVLMAVIGAAHGIRGEVRVKSFTGDPVALSDYGPLFDASGRPFEIQAIRSQQEVVVVRFKGISDRTQAERLNGTELFVERSGLPAVDEEEFYHDDLVGLAVRDEDGSEIGKIIAVQNFGGGDVLELSVDGRKEILIPFTRAAVPEVSVTQGFIRIERVAAGLVDEEEGEEPTRPGFDARRRNRGPKQAGGNR